jgi:glucose-6-phosphate-specific signal transduction histidine kinase
MCPWVGCLPRSRRPPIFVVAEALTNVAKHARAGHAEVTARIEDSTVQVQRRDDGVGGALPDGGGGLIGLADRLAALDGEPRVDSPAKSGTLVAAASPYRVRLSHIYLASMLRAQRVGSDPSIPSPNAS